MDPRHESLVQEISNEIIYFINKYIQEHVDEVIVTDGLCDDMKKISAYLYQQADMPVDVKNILSKRNFLSIDPVFLPSIQSDNLKKASEYLHFINELKLLVANKSNPNHSEFYHHILTILTRYRA